MAYVSDSNLTQFWGLAKDYIKAENSRYANWQKTEKAGAVTCWPVGGTELLPTVDFLFTEAPPASGTKGPDNPSTITGVSSITVTRCETVGVDSTDYTIDLDGTYYGGSIDLATGLMTVTHVNKIITSNKIGTFASADTCVGCRIGLDSVNFKATGTKTTDKFINDASGSATFEHFRTLSSPVYNMLVLYVSKTRLDFSEAVDPSNPTDAEMRAAFIAWIADNPVAFCGELSAPYTVQLTPTQILSLTQTDKYTPRLNTVYTDASAVQVGYAKSPIRSEYELTQAIIATEGGE